MTEITNEFRKTGINKAGFAALSTPQEIYDYAELKYGSGFAQYCFDILTGNQGLPSNKPPKDHHMNNLIRLTSQLHTLSEVCKADFFQTWGAEDKLYYMTLLTTVSNDLSQALQGSLNEISSSKEAGSSS